MDGLFPIIRRIRRPLLHEDAPPVVVGNIELLKVEAVRAKEAKEAKEAKAGNPRSKERREEAE